ncbi:hypothetical protein ACFTAO_36320 [Paenibacillus rhizoplanae]
MPKLELDLSANPSVGIITDLRRKQLLMEQLSRESGNYLSWAGQNEYMRLTVEELISFLTRMSGREERAAVLADYFALKEERKVRLMNLSSSKRVYVTLLRAFFRPSVHARIGGAVFLSGGAGPPPAEADTG